MDFPFEHPSMIHRPYYTNLHNQVVQVEIVDMVQVAGIVEIIEIVEVAQIVAVAEIIEIFEIVEVPAISEIDIFDIVKIVEILENVEIGNGLFLEPSEGVNSEQFHPFLRLLQPIGRTEKISRQLEH